MDKQPGGRAFQGHRPAHRRVAARVGRMAGGVILFLIPGDLISGTAPSAVACSCSKSASGLEGEGSFGVPDVVRTSSAPIPGHARSFFSTSDQWHL